MMILTDAPVLGLIKQCSRKLEPESRKPVPYVATTRLKQVAVQNTIQNNKDGLISNFCPPAVFLKITAQYFVK